MQTTSTSPKPDDGKPNRQIKPEILSQLKEFKDKHGLSDEKIGRDMGSSGTYVNRAFNGEFIGDPEKFEQKIVEYIYSEGRRRELAAGIFQNAFVRNVHSFIDHVSHTNDFGIFWSEAGMGKTTANNSYLAKHSTAIGVTVTQQERTPNEVLALIVSELTHRTWKRKHGKSMWNFAREKLKGTSRLLLIDNGQKLSKSADSMLLDLHDATGIPIFILGNPEMFDRFADNDQKFSRVGLALKITSGEKPDKDAERMIALYWPEAQGEINSEAIKVAAGFGHLRTLQKQLLLAKEILGDYNSKLQAFLAAGTLLIKGQGDRK